VPENPSQVSPTPSPARERAGRRPRRTLTQSAGSEVGEEATTHGGVEADQQQPRRGGTGPTPGRGNQRSVGSPGDERPGGGNPGNTQNNLRALPNPGTFAFEELYRGRTRLALIRDLAMGEWSNKEIASQLGATPEAIAAFAADHADEISEVRAALAGHLAIETAGLWVSKKQNRLAEYQQDIEDCELIVAAMRKQLYGEAEELGVAAETVLGGLGSRRHHNLMKTKLALMKAVADELSPRMGVTFTPSNEDEDKNTVRYVIEASEFGDDLT
jgi:hypothetical protein